MMKHYLYPLDRKTVFGSEHDARTGLVKVEVGLANGRRRSQTRCCLDVCRKLCPYRDRKFVASVVSMNEDNDAVTLARLGEDGCWRSCMVVYLHGRCDHVDVDGHELEFARRHSPRIMDECPLMMEHQLHEWNRKKN